MTHFSDIVFQLREMKINDDNLPVAPVKRVLINSLLFVKFVSHDAHEYNLMPLIWSKNTRPIFFIKTSLFSPFTGKLVSILDLFLKIDFFFLKKFSKICKRFF